MDDLKYRVNSLYDLYAGMVSAEKMVFKAAKLDALDLMRSEDVFERILALEKLVFEDPLLDKVPTAEEAQQVLDQIDETIADSMARRAVEDNIERKIAAKLEERHAEYVQDIKMQVLKEEHKSIENPTTKKKLQELEALEGRGLTQSILERLRPTALDAIVGQERAVLALRAKLASPYPQHLLLYGPPGVGKTTAARLVLEEAKRLAHTPFAAGAPFVEVDGTTLRWDPRDITNPLLGSVHDPIYQGARRDLAETGIPEPKPGLVTDAQGGILFIDEIGEMDVMLQNKLLKVLEDKRVFFDSAYYDTTDENVPRYIRKLFKDGAPADFILIGATTRDTGDISPAIRSRCAEVYFEPLTPEDIRRILLDAAAKLQVGLAADVPLLISEYTIEGRKAINILADAFAMALYRRGQVSELTADDIHQVAQVSRLTPYVSAKASATYEVGKVFGLGVAGYLGSVLEIEAVVFTAAESGKGSIRFNDTAGSMAKDSVFNAAAAVRCYTGCDLADYDLHINVIGGGLIDGPSAGTAIFIALVSALQQRPVRQDIAVTGEISLRGRVKAVGGVFEKAYGARQAGMKSIIIPKDNEGDIPAGHLGLQVCPVTTAEEVIALLLLPKD